VPIIGTTPDAIDLAEDRERFQGMINKLELLQPSNAIVRSSGDAINAATAIGYPLVVRPSYVLGGRAMEIVYQQDELARYMDQALKVSGDAPILLDYFLSSAIEVDIDAVSDGKDVVIGAIMQHIEQAGIPSGASACALPPYSLPSDVQNEMREIVKTMAIELQVKGLMNVQLAWQDGKVYVIEVNPRAARTVPFVSKCIGISLAKVAARCMAGVSLKDQDFIKEITPNFFSVKEAVLPFNKFPGVDPILGPERKSTGEAMGVGRTFAEAYLKAELGAGNPIPSKGTAFLSVRDPDKSGIVDVAISLINIGFKLVATEGTSRILSDAGCSVETVNKVQEGRPHIVDMIKNDQIDLIINTTEGRQAIAASAPIRSSAEQHGVYYTTTLAGGEAVCMALQIQGEIKVNKLQDLHLRGKE
jgi:carbamoyl-phosphate synthase large subunit